VLDPDQRELLLDALRPPAGYRLDIAVGTTFTLDLQALLLAPLAFAFFESGATEDEETSGPDPVALLAALREASERLHIFCQAGRIAVPRQYRRVLALVEDTVHAVSAPTPAAIFHPKVWALRFTAAHEPRRYRLVTLSRNLTFDRSWDTLVRLEGIGGDGPTEQGAPLAQFVRALPALAVRPLHSRAQADIATLADELAGVGWEVPSPFLSVQFHALGLPGPPPRPFAGRADRLLVISPFLGAGALAELAPHASARILVSRPESLDGLGSAALTGYADTFVLAASAQGVEPEAELGDGAPESTSAALSGLHAKVYVVESGWDTRVLTGSANATEAALWSNVEFLVDLQGRRSKCGIDTILEAGKGQASFRDLLERYEVQNVDPLDPEERELLLRDLERCASELASQAFRATVEPGADHDAYAVSLRGEGRLPSDVHGRVRPISNQAGSAVPLDALASGTEARFERVSFEAITSFFVIELSLTRGPITESTAFVVNAELVGAPEDRLSRLFTAELGSRRSVLRYLLLLLAVGGVDTESMLGLAPGRDGQAAANGAPNAGLPLLESLVRTLAEDPSRLDGVDRLIADLERTEEGRALLPDDLLDIWEAFRSVRSEVAS
jgi:hypothetical protein